MKRERKRVKWELANIVHLKGCLLNWSVCIEINRVKVKINKLSYV